jgi:hypothetical protein
VIGIYFVHLVMKTYICKCCNKNFESKKGCKSRIPKFCSKECYAESLRLHIKCKLCGNEIENKHSVSIKNRVYCSLKCHSESRKNKPLPEKWKIALSEGRKKSEKCKGKNLYNWKGGKETESIRMKQYFYKRKKLLKLDMPVQYLKNVLIAQNNQCFFCDSKLEEYKAIEHLTPVSKGGDNHTFNLVYSCKSCNSKKRQQTLEEFAVNNNRFDLLDKFDYIYATAIS